METLNLFGNEKEDLDIIDFNEFLDINDDWRDCASSSKSYDKCVIFPLESGKYIYYICQDEDERIMLYRKRK